MAKWTNSAEGGSDGTTVTTGNSGDGSGDAWTAVLRNSGTLRFSNAAAAVAHGALGYEIAGLSGSPCELRRHSFTANATLMQSVYYRAAADPSTDNGILRINTEGGSQAGTVFHRSTGRFRTINAAGADVGTDPGAGFFIANVRYRLELRVTRGADTTSGIIEGRAYLGDSRIPLWSSTATGVNAQTTDLGDFRLGKTSTGTSTDTAFFDSIQQASGSDAILNMPWPTPAPADGFIRMVAEQQNLTSETTVTVPMFDAGDVNSELSDVDSHLVMLVAVNNSGTDGAATTISVADDALNTWTSVDVANNDPGAANEGTTCRVLIARCDNAYTNGDEITVTFGDATTAKAITVWEVSGLDPDDPIVATNTATGTSGTPSVAVTPTAAGQLVLGALAIEGPSTDTYTVDADTTDGVWGDAGSRSTHHATAETNQTLHAAAKKVTGTSAQTWNPTITSRDWAAVAVVLRQYVPLDPIVMSVARATASSVEVSWTHPTDAPDGVSIARAPGAHVNDDEDREPSDANYDPFTIAGCVEVTTGETTSPYFDVGLAPGTYTYWVYRTGGGA